MTGGHEQLEGELSRHLADAAPVPARDSAARLRARLAGTPQRTGPMVGLADAFRSVAWTRVAAVAGVAAVALVVGVYIGQVGLPIQLGPSSSPSADADPSVTPSGPEAWVEPGAYSYVLESTCGERMLIGRFRITVAGGVVKDAESLLDPPTLPVALEEMPTLGDLLAELEEARRSGAYVATLVSDTVDGHPLEIMIDHDQQTVDDEACYQITDYVVGGQPSGTPAPSAPAGPTSYAVWERFDMADPAPDVYGGARPLGVAPFGDGYVAVGTLSGCCAGEPSENTGVIWTSTDGRDWQLVDTGATFEHASLDQVLTLRSQLLVAGTHAEPVDGGLATQVGATWVSSDGVSWRRADGPAPSMVTVTPDGLFGADLGENGVSYFASTDGLAWTPLGTWEDMDGLTAVVGTPERLLVVGRAPGEPLEDGSPTFDVLVRTSADRTNWTGGAAIRNAHVTSAVAWPGGFAAVGSRYSQQADGAMIGEASVWTSPDGLSWEERGGGIGHPSETSMEVFAIDESLVITVECCGGDLVLRPPAWVSEDGLEWSPILAQPAFEGSEIVVTASIETPRGLLAVGHRAEGEVYHRVPESWTASSEPMVWQLPTSQPGADVGDETPFAMGHCGFRSPIDFDGSLWAPMDRDPWALEFDSATGTITLLEPDRARFVSDAGDAVTLARLEGAAAYLLCG